MLDDNTYNLLTQLVQEHKSLWRIKNMYLEDSSNSDDDKVVRFWEQLINEKERNITELLDLVRIKLEVD